MTSLPLLIEQGGIFMIPLLLASVLALAIGLERLVFFLSLERGGEAFREGLLQAIRSGRCPETLESLRPKRGVVAATALAALENWEQTPEVMESAMGRQARRASGNLFRFLRVLDTTVTASPLIGLLGTITGMMGVFRVVAQKLARDPQADTSGITAGIGEALIATATGILVAVVALLIHNFFLSWAEGQMEEAERLADDLKLVHREQAG